MWHELQNCDRDVYQPAVPVPAASSNTQTPSNANACQKYPFSPLSSRREMQRLLRGFLRNMQRFQLRIVGGTFWWTAHGTPLIPICSS